MCCSPPLGWGLPTGRRQTVVTLPAGAEACFFTDGLTEARCASAEQGDLLGRERLSEILDSLGPRLAAADLLTAVRAAARATPDDMAACILAPRTPARGARIHIEVLETDEQALAAGNVGDFLAACGLPSREIARAVETAKVTSAAWETAVLRVERSGTGVAATVGPPLARPQQQAIFGPEPPPAAVSALRDAVTTT